jgi:hypothetical protein
VLLLCSRRALCVGTQNEELEQELEELKEVFVRIDKDGNGSLDAEEVGVGVWPPAALPAAAPLRPSSPHARA